MSERCTVSKMTMKLMHRVLGHSLVHSLVHLHCLLNCFLRSACFALTLHCAHSFVRSLAHSLAPALIGKRFLGSGSGGKRRRQSPVEQGNPVHMSVRPSRPPGAPQRLAQGSQGLAQASQSRSSQLMASLCEAWDSL